MPLFTAFTLAMLSRNILIKIPLFVDDLVTVNRYFFEFVLLLAFFMVQPPKEILVVLKQALVLFREVARHLL